MWILLIKIFAIQKYLDLTDTATAIFRPNPGRGEILHPIASESTPAPGKSGPEGSEMLARQYFAACKAILSLIDDDLAISRTPVDPYPKFCSFTAIAFQGFGHRSILLLQLRRKAIYYFCAVYCEVY